MTNIDASYMNHFRLTGKILFQSLALYFCTYFICLSLNAERLPPNSKPVLHLITSSSIAPYVISEKDSGIAVDIIREALALKGYRVHFTYSTNRRVLAELERDHVDGAFNLPYSDQEANHLYLSQPIVAYENVVVTLAEQKLKLSEVSDLTNLQLVVFQNASLYLPDAYAQMAKLNPNIEEVSDQKSQVYMLFMRRAQAIILDRRIFEYFRSQLSHQSAVFDDPYKVHTLFSQAPRFAIFRDQSVRNEFNEGLNTLVNNGRYQAIVAKYIN